MALGGLTFASIKATMARVVENGIDQNDPRVMDRTNQATRELLGEIIPVGGLATYDIVADGTTLLLPKELENSIECEVQGMGTVNDQSDVKQGFVQIVSQYTYLDPSQQHDNPLVDQFLQPDPGDPTILRRQYEFPGLTPNATVRVTGAKRYIPITSDDDYLIIQNVEALESMVTALERRYNCNDPDGADKYKQNAIGILQAEVKKHLLDPSNSMKRKANYETDMVTFAVGTFGWMRARLAFELPGGLLMGKSELTRILEQAEMRCIDRGQFIGTIQEYDAQVSEGIILCPKEVLAIVALTFCGVAIDVKNLFFKYTKHGRHWWHFSGCGPELRDEGEQIYPNGDRRRQYRLTGRNLDIHTMRFAAVLRWVKKQPTDQMVIKNFEAIRLMSQAILNQKQEKWNEAQVEEGKAIEELDRELSQYLSGQMIVAPVDFGMGLRAHGLL